MRSAIVGLSILVLLCSRAGAQDVLYKLSGTPTKFTVGAENVALTIDVPASSIPAQLTIVCDGTTFDCTKVKLGGAASKKVSPGDASARQAIFEIPGGAAATSFDGNVLYEGVASMNLLTFASTAAGPPKDDASLGTLLATMCDERLVTTTATFVVTPFGRVVKQNKPRITDRDRIEVSILANTELEPVLTLKEGSDLATPSVTNIYGADLPIFKNTSKAGGKPIAPVPCRQSAATPLGPFASPKGTVLIEAHVGIEEKQVGSFQFQVNPTYTGAFSLGGGLTTAFSPSFEKAFNGTDTVIVAHGDRHRFLYIATYTHYLWKPRDLSFVKGLDPQIFPFVGVVLNDVTDNALAGVSLELQPGFALVFAQHIARVTVLDTSTGAALGGAFNNRAASVPTDKRWTSMPFYGVVVDARAVAGLLKTLLDPK